jgi:hypothetical protein
LKIDLNNSNLPIQQESLVSLDLFKALFVSFVQRVSEQNFPIKKNIRKGFVSNADLKSLIREQEFFECKDPNILITIVR